MPEVVIELAVDPDTFEAAQALSIASGLPVGTVLSRLLGAVDAPAPPTHRKRRHGQAAFRTAGATGLATLLVLGGALWLHRTARRA